MSSTDLNRQAIKKILKKANTIAIIGCSDKKHRTSNRIAGYLKKAGYTIIPINPNIDGRVLGEEPYDSLNELPDGIRVDIVNIFRNRKYTAEMVRQAAEWSADRGQKPLVWTQLDVSSSEAEEIARQQGLDYVKNSCIFTEHKRYF